MLVVMLVSLYAQEASTGSTEKKIVKKDGIEVYAKPAENNVTAQENNESKEEEVVWDVTEDYNLSA